MPSSGNTLAVWFGRSDLNNPYGELFKKIILIFASEMWVLSLSQRLRKVQRRGNQVKVLNRPAAVSSAYVLNTYLLPLSARRMGRRSDTGASQKTCRHFATVNGFRGIKLENDTTILFVFRFLRAFFSFKLYRNLKGFGRR